MRTYTFTRPCGHAVRGTNKARSLATPCNECLRIGATHDYSSSDHCLRCGAKQYESEEHYRPCTR